MPRLKLKQETIILHRTFRNLRKKLKTLSETDPVYTQIYNQINIINHQILILENELIEQYNENILQEIDEYL